jgi:Flp pilus assembly protein TadB
MLIPVFLLIATVLGSTVGIYAILMTDKKKREKNRPRQKKLPQTTKAYDFLYNNFLTRDAFRGVVEQLSSLSIFNFQEIRILSVRYYTRSLAASVAVVFAGIIFLRELIAVLLIIVFAIVLHTTLIDKMLDKLHTRLLKELSTALSSVHGAYTRLGNVPDAINECEKGKYLQKAFDRIHLILTSNESEELLDEFYRTVPFQMLQTFAGVCYLLNDIGDEYSPDGQSSFKTSIHLLKNEVDLEIRKITKRNLLFGSLAYMPLVPIPALGALRAFFIANIPGTASFYNGLMGYVSQTVIILAALFGYWMISQMNGMEAVSYNDRAETIDKLSRLRWFKPIVKHILPKKMRIRHNIEALLKGALSRKDITYIYTSKVLISFITFVFVLLVMLIFTYTAKDYIRDSVSTVSLLGSANIEAQYAEQLRILDEEVLAQDRVPRGHDLEVLIKARFPQMSAMDQQEQVDRVEKKYVNYHNTYFRWWYVVIAYGLSAVAWFVPEMLVSMRRRVVMTEAEEDVLQMQTMLSILMYTNLDTLSTLWWLGKQSRVHKAALVYAYHEYPSDPEKALNRLKDKSPLPEFHNIVSKLLSTIYQISLAEAFSELISEREHLLAIREMVYENAIGKRRMLASPIARAPLMLCVVLYALAPIVLLAGTEFLKIYRELMGG